ncbi:hypothetical protein APHAL10511_003195 [Amanita phalloides]|nr:hypothetical protein APHAL10511_003195 [Amanita phalloides]
MFNAAGIRQSRWERNGYLCCAVVLFYEYFLQLDSEVEYFWERRWSLAKVLFLWSRYFGLMFNISNAAVYMQKQPSFDVRYRFFHWQDTGASLQIITTHLILELRIWAMYGNSRKMFFVLLFLIIAEATAMGVIFGVPRADLVATNNPLNGVYICADGDPTNGHHWAVFFWLASLVIDLILFFLAMWKAWEHRSKPQSRLMREVVAQSVLYFVAIFWIYVANMVIWFVNRITLNEFGTPFSFVIPSICANRLLISCRRNNQPDELTIISTFRRQKRHPNETSGNVELTTCDNVQIQTVP